jgi:hypothetical protein
MANVSASAAIAYLMSLHVITARFCMLYLYLQVQQMTKGKEAKANASMTPTEDRQKVRLKNIETGAP